MWIEFFKKSQPLQTQKEIEIYLSREIQYILDKQNPNGS